MTECSYFNRLKKRRNQRDKKLPKLAFWFRYGSQEHVELFFSTSAIIKELSHYFEVYYFSFKSKEKPGIHPEIGKYAKVYELPITISRLSHVDKLIKTGLWIAISPLLSIWCFILGIRIVYVDETLPLLSFIGYLFFRKKFAVTIADMFLDQYMHSNKFFHAISSAIKSLDHYAWRHLSIIITRSQNASNQLKQFNISSRHVYYAYDAINPSLYKIRNKHDCREIMGWDKGKTYLVYHGLLGPNKALDWILYNLVEILEKYPVLHFYIIGNGPDENKLRKLAHDLKIMDHITFAGFVAPEKVVYALGAGDIGLITRRGDTGDHLVITSVLGHCLGCGLPVLATATGGITEIITDGYNGLLFSPMNEQEFQTQLTTLILNPDIRTSLSSRGCETAAAKLSVANTVTCNIYPFVKNYIMTETKREIPN